jgi:riboflavin kinase/FMN adenylyltransferase
MPEPTPETASRVAPSVVAPGNHDGVHLGHRALIRTAREYGQPRNLRAVALTFDPHPAQLLSPERVPPLLTTIERRRELLLGVGADDVVIQRFDARFANLSPEDFLKTSIIDLLGARALVVGTNFKFGNNRRGDIDTLRRLGRKYGIRVLVVEPVRVGDDWISSSAVRRAIADGDLQRATTYLDRYHELNGKVVAGDGRGRTLGTPTANLRCEPAMQPPDGVYVVAARRVDPGHPDHLFGVANIGERPTFGSGRAVEAHFFNFDGDLYGARLRIGLVRRLRGERSFANADELRSQIEADSRQARAVIKTVDREKLELL